MREKATELGNPCSIGDALKGFELGTYWKYCMGDYRIMAKIKDQIARVLVVKIGNRRKMYRQ